MITWSEYLKNSFGVRIFLGVCLLLVCGIMIARIIERTRLEGGNTEEDNDIQSIRAVKRLLIGMLTGFAVTVVIGVTQFIVRFRSFSLLQEIGAVTIGVLGAVVGGICGIIRWRRKPARHNQEAARRR